MLDTLKVQYSPSVFQVQSTHEIVNDRLMVKFFTHYNKGNIITQQIEKDGSVANNQVYVNTNGLLLDKTAVCQAYYQEPGGFRGPTFEETYAVHKALGKSLSAKTPPRTYYNTGGLATLVDGLRARAPRDNRQWLAWHNEDVQLTIDLSSEQLINNVSLSMHDEIQSQIFLPEKIQIEIGTDGNDFSVVKELNRQDIKTNFETQQLLRFPFDNTVFGRQVRVTLFYDRKAPVKPWMFISEVEVD
jgi:hexosaminidase